MTIDPIALKGQFVVEIGARQAWAFVTFCEPGGDSESRLFIDTAFTVGETRVSSSDPLHGLAAIGRVANLTVNEASKGASGDLSLVFDDGTTMAISGAGESWTTHAPWWLAPAG